VPAQLGPTIAQCATDQLGGAPSSPALFSPHCLESRAWTAYMAYPWF
jgi:hypothetical protein